MNKLSKMIANGTITVEELANASKLIERAKLVAEGLNACRRTIIFPLGNTESVNCYSYTDSAGEYEAWGECSVDGTFKCFCNWGGNHLIGKCDLTSYTDTFLAFDNEEFSADLMRFLKQHIEKSKKQ